MSIAINRAVALTRSGLVKKTGKFLWTWILARNAVRRKMEEEEVYQSFFG